MVETKDRERKVIKRSKTEIAEALRKLADDIESCNVVPEKFSDSYDEKRQTAISEDRTRPNNISVFQLDHYATRTVKIKVLMLEEAAEEG